ARVVLPSWVVATRLGGLNVAVDPREVRSARALDGDWFDAHSAYSAPPVGDLEVEVAGSDDAEEATMNGNGGEGFVNTKVRRIVRLMQGKHPPFVRFG
ncbi:hypothetical protein AAVH_15117, partial [Aphelenchoides avenae]